jgi:hypothetical protein
MVRVPPGSARSLSAGWVPVWLRKPLTLGESPVPTQVTCPSCRAVLTVPDQHAGKALRCPRCKAVLPARAATQQAFTKEPAPAFPGPAAAESEPLDVLPLEREESGARGGGGLAVGLVVGGVIAAVLLLIGLIGGGGLLAFWWLRSSPAPSPGVTGVKPADGHGGPARVGPRVPDPGPPPGLPPAPPPAPPPGPPPAPPPVPRLELPPLPDPVAIKPAPVRKETSYKLPEQVASLRVGGAGRFLILHFPKVRKFGVFDANEAKIVRYIPAGEDDVRFAAGMTKLVLYLPGAKVVQRYDLLTGAREKVGKLDLPEGKIEAFCMGHASAGPLLVGVANHGAGLYDIESFKEIPLPAEAPPGRFPRFGDKPTVRRLSGGYYWAGATGRVFGHTGNYGMPNGVQTVVLTGGKVETYGQHKGTWFVMPGPDDKHVYAGGHGVISERVTPVSNVPFSMEGNSGRANNLYLPAHHGPYYLHAQTVKAFDRLPGAPDLFGGIPGGTIRIFVLGDKRPIATYSDTAVCKHGLSWEALRGLGIEYSIHLIPKAKLLVVVPGSRDELRLYPVDLESALEKSGRDYLIFTSSPPARCAKGRTFTYQAEVIARKKPVTFRLESGPEGMTVSAAGLVRWEVPAGLASDPASVILAAKDTGGQEVFQTFTLTVEGK